MLDIDKNCLYNVIISFFGVHMIKIIAWHFGLGVLLNVVTVIITAIAYSLLSVLLAYFTGFIFTAIVVHLAVAVFCGGGGIYWIAHLFNLKTHLSRMPQYPDGHYEKLWYRPIKRNRPIKFIRFQATLLLFLFFAVGFIFLAKFQYSNVAKAVYDTGALGGWVLAVIVSVSAMMWLIYWFYLMIHYACATCRCGRVMTRAEGSTENYDYSTSTQTKTKDTYGVIGEVYEDDQKVGEVKGTTGHYTVEREVHQSSWTSVCHCIYCGRVKKVHHSDSYYGDWKYN